MNGMKECLFCRIVRKEIPARIVHEDDLVVAFEDVRPHAPVHVLIVPRRHVAGVGDLGEGDAAAVAAIHAAARRVAEAKGVAASGYRLVANTGPDAGQEVMHLHYHLLAGRKLTWPPG